MEEKSRLEGEFITAARIYIRSTILFFRSKKRSTERVLTRRFNERSIGRLFNERP